MVVNAEDVVNIMGGMEQSGGIKLNDHKRKLKNRFEICKKLGQGTYGKVQLGINKETGQEVAIKTIKKSKIETEADLIRIRREIQIMSSVQHPNIIHIYEVFENKEKMVLVMEVAAGGELYDYLSDRKSLDEIEARRVFRQIATAVYYCHKHNICHRDLKLENILLDEDGGAKIADFGLSNVFDRKNLLNTFCGSPLYASPEIVKGCPYEGPEVDCWSLGVLLYTLVYGAMPFDGSNFKRLVKQITTGDYYEPKQPASASSLIRGMLTVNAEARASILDICAHWWINEGYPTSCLEEAEYLSTLTPVRLDLLLSLAPQSKTKESKDGTEKEEASVANDDATTMSIEEMPEDAQIPTGVEECDVSLSEEPPEDKSPAVNRKERESKSKRKLEQTSSMVEPEIVHKKHESEAVIKQQSIPQPPKISVPEPMEVSDVPQVYERPRSRRTREEKETKDNLRTPRVRRKHQKSSDEISDKVHNSVQSKSQDFKSHDDKVSQKVVDKNSNSEHPEKHHKVVRKEKKKHTDQNVSQVAPCDQTQAYESRTKTPPPLQLMEPPRSPPPAPPEKSVKHASPKLSPSIPLEQPESLKPQANESFERPEPQASPRHPPIPPERSDHPIPLRPPPAVPTEHIDHHTTQNVAPLQEHQVTPIPSRPPPPVPIKEQESQKISKPHSIPHEQPDASASSEVLPPIPYERPEPPKSPPPIPFERPEPHASQRPPRLPSPDFYLEPVPNHDAEMINPSCESDHSIPPPLPEKKKKSISVTEEKSHCKEMNIPKKNTEEVVKKSNKNIQSDVVKSFAEAENKNTSNAINHNDVKQTGETEILESQKSLTAISETMQASGQLPATHSTLDNISKTDQTAESSNHREAMHQQVDNTPNDSNQKNIDKSTKESGNSRQLNSNSSVIIPLDESNFQETAKSDLPADETKREKQPSHIENGPNIDIEKRTENIGKPCAIVNISAESPKDPDGKGPSGPSPAIQHQNERKLPSDVKPTSNRTPLKIVRKNSKRFGSPPLVKPFPTQSQQYKNNNNNNAVQQCWEGDDKVGRQLDKKDELIKINSQPKLKEETISPSSNLNKIISTEEQSNMAKVEHGTNALSNNNQNNVAQLENIEPVDNLPKPSKLEESIVQSNKQELIMEKNGCPNESLMERRTVDHKDYKKVPPLVIPFPGKQNSPTDLIKQDSPKLLINSIPKPFRVESPKEKEIPNNEITGTPKIILNDVKSKDKTPDTDKSLSPEIDRHSTPDSPQIMSKQHSESPGPYVGIKATHSLKDLDRQKPEPEKRDSKVIKAAQYWNNYIGECSSKSKPPPKASDKPKKIISAGIGEKGLKELTNAFETGKPIEPNDKFTLMRRNSKKMSVDNCQPGLRVNDAKSVFEKKNMPETPRVYRRSSVSSEKSKWSGSKSETEGTPSNSNTLIVNDEKVSTNSVSHSKSNSNARQKSKSKSKSPIPPQHDKPKSPAPSLNDIDTNKSSHTSNNGTEKIKERKHRSSEKPDLAPKPKTPEVPKDRDDKHQEINLNIPKEQPKPPTSPKPKVKKEDLKLKEEHVKGKEEKLHPQRNCKKIDDSMPNDKGDGVNLKEKIVVKSPEMQRKSDSKHKLVDTLAEKRVETVKSPPLQKKSDSKKELVIINHSKKQAVDKISRQISKNMGAKDKEGNNEKKTTIEDKATDKKKEVDMIININKNSVDNVNADKEIKNTSYENEPLVKDSIIKIDDSAPENIEINDKPDIDQKQKINVGKSAENTPRTKNEFADVRSSLKKVPHVAVARKKSFTEKDVDEVIEPSTDNKSPVKEYKSEVIIPINMPAESPPQTESPTIPQEAPTSNHIVVQQPDQDAVKERIIPIKLVNESKASGPKPFKLDTNNSRPQSPNNNQAPTGVLSPKTHSKQEHYIPIVVQGKGSTSGNPREDESEHSERLDNFNTSSISRRRWGSRKKRMSSAFSDSSVSDDDALTTPFGGLQKYTSYGKHGIHEQPLFRLKKTRPPFSVTRTDSFSSGEDDLDDDGFQEMTAENLFSTLLSRVKSLTRRIHDEHDEHLNWQQKQRHAPPKLNPGGTHARLERTAQRSSIKRTGDSTPSYTRQSSTYSSKGEDTPRSFNDSPTRPIGRSDSTYNPTRIYNRSVSNAENDSWYSDGTAGSRMSGGISKRYDLDSDMGSDYSSNISVTSKQRLRPGYLPPPASNLNDNSYNSYSNRNSTSSDFSRNERTVPISIQRQDSHESPTSSKPGTPLPAQGVYMKHMKPFCPTQTDDYSENSSRMDSPEPLSEGSALRKGDDRQRRVSRFLRPDFYETPKEESIYAKMRELEAEETKKPRFLRVVQQRKAKGESSSGRNTPLDFNSYSEDKSLSESGSRTPQPEESKMAPPSEGSRASNDLRSLMSRRQPSMERKISSELNELENDILQAGINKLRREGVEHSTEVSEMSDGLRTPENSEITNEIFGVPDFVKEGERSIGERLRKKSYLSRLNENDATPIPKRGGPVTRRSVSKELFDDGLSRYTSSRPVARRSVSRELFTPSNGKPPRDYASESESILSRRNPRRSRDSSLDRDTDVLSELETPSVPPPADRSRSISLNRSGPRSESLSRFLPSRPSIASSGRTSKQNELLRGSGITPTSDLYRKSSVISPTADLYRVSPLTVQSHDLLRVSPRTVLGRASDDDEGYGNGFKDRRRSDWRRISVPERGKDYNSLPRKYNRLDKKSFQ